jgi:endonuclease I
MKKTTMKDNERQIKQARVDAIITQVKTVVPADWQVTEGFSLSLGTMASSPIYVCASRTGWQEWRIANRGAADYRERYNARRAETIAMAREFGHTLEHLLNRRVRIDNDGTLIVPNAESEVK